jgi:polysaccharide deacetylase family protein (PEP-CTERM system associated)
MNNALSFDVEDWFQVENLKPAIPRERWDTLELRVEANTRRILALLRERDVKATFFVLGWVAERCPGLVKDIDREGHEVASHGYGHHLIYEMTPEDFREDLVKSKRILEEQIGKPVEGYRAPSFSITPETPWALDILKDAGFRYDSSIFPVSFHDRYGFPGASHRPFAWPNGLMEIPLAVYPIGKYFLPAAGGGYFRLFPYRYFRHVFARLNRNCQAFTFYLHPWELDPDQPRMRVPWFYRFRHYVNLRKTEGRLRRLLEDFRFTTIPRAYAAEMAGQAGRPVRLVLMIDRIGSNLAGTENQLLKIVKGLDRRRFDIHLICLDDRPWFQQHRSEFNCATYLIPINRFRQPGTYVNFLRLVGLLRRLAPDVVHTFFPVANIVGVLAARIARVHHIVSSRRDYGEWMLPRYLIATRFANRFVSRVVTNSPQVKALTQRMENVPANRIEVIYNGIDLAGSSGLRRDEALKQSLGIPAGNKVVGIVANFRPMKRHETFVRAAEEVLRQRSDVDFVLLGEAFVQGRQDQLESLARSLGVRERLHFLGRRPEVLRYLSFTDIGVNCSQGEGLSNAVMEYMAAGVPCVVSDSGGNPDLVSPDVHGAVFRLDDHKGLAAEILRLLDDPQRCKRYAENARRRIDTEMSLPAMLRAYEGFYERLAGPAFSQAGKPEEISQPQPARLRR